MGGEQVCLLKHIVLNLLIIINGFQRSWKENCIFLHILNIISLLIFAD